MNKSGAEQFLVSPPSTTSTQTFYTFSTPEKYAFASKNGNKFECRVCEENFELSGEKVPRLLFCGHTLCHSCLCSLNADMSISCPFDRQPTTLGTSGVWSLKKNFALLELLESLSLKNSVFTAEILFKEKELGIACDEDDSHIALLYCTVCSSHLCLECSQSTHATKTLHIHKRIPLSEKPREKPRCVDHSSHPVEFLCLEQSCVNAPLMCFICKEYKHTNHEHALLDQEAEKLRTRLSSTLQIIRKNSSKLREIMRNIESTSIKIEGSSTSSHISNLENSEVENLPENENNRTGTAEEARNKISQYFDELRSNLLTQEMTALRILDTHVREKLCSMRQQQEDITNLLSQMVSVVMDGERAMQQDDGRFVLSAHDLALKIAQINLQEQQIFNVVQQPDATIPITFTKDNRIHIGARIEMRVVTLGLDGAGKTTILFRMKNNEFLPTNPTIGFNVEIIEYKNFKFTIWDVGGQPKLRPLWRHYFFNTQAVIFVVDVSDHMRIEQSRDELSKLMIEKELKDASLLIFANKQNSPGALTINELKQKLDTQKLCAGRSWHVQPCDALSGIGLEQGLDWLARQLVPSPTPGDNSLE